MSRPDDPNLARCGNCSEREEDHGGVRCIECGNTYRHCPQTFDGPNDCSSHADGVQFRSETDEDRKADWAKAHGL